MGSMMSKFPFKIEQKNEQGRGQQHALVFKNLGEEEKLVIDFF
jgi:hypothetical protein